MSAILPSGHLRTVGPDGQDAIGHFPAAIERVVVVIVIVAAGRVAEQETGADYVRVESRIAGARGPGPGEPRRHGRSRPPRAPAARSMPAASASSSLNLSRIFATRSASLAGTGSISATSTRSVTAEPTVTMASTAGFCELYGCGG